MKCANRSCKTRRSRCTPCAGFCLFFCTQLLAIRYALSRVINYEEVTAQSGKIMIIHSIVSDVKIIMIKHREFLWEFLRRAQWTCRERRTFLSNAWTAWQCNNHVARVNLWAREDLLRTGAANMNNNVRSGKCGGNYIFKLDSPLFLKQLVN